MNKCLWIFAFLTCSVQAHAACTVEWPAPVIQKMELAKAVKASNEGAEVTDVVIAAPGLATVSFAQHKQRQKAIVAFEHRSAECAAKPEDLAQNPTLFRVLSYQSSLPMPRK